MSSPRPVPGGERPVPGSTRSVVAVAVLFALNGVVIGAFGGSLPSIRARLGIDSALLPVIIMSGGIAGVVSMQVGGRLADAWGARQVSIATMPFMVAGAAVLALATTLPMAVIGAVLIGLGNGAMDVAMNAIAVLVEKERPRPLMSRFHAFWSIGSFTGAAIVLLTARVYSAPGAVVAPAMTVTALGALALFLAARSRVPATPAVHHDAEGGRGAIPRVAWLLGAMAACFGLTEGTAADWSSVHVTDVTGVDPGTGAIGLAAVSIFMVLVRLLGDLAVGRFGRTAVVRWGALIAMAGYLITIIATSLPAVLAGWSLVGFGVGMIAPQIYAVAGHIGSGRMLAIVVSFGYTAFLVGPALIGWLVHAYGVQRAMVLPWLLAAVLVVLARWMPDIGRQNVD